MSSDPALRSTTITLGPFETNAYVIACAATGACAIADVGFDPERVAREVAGAGLEVRYLLITHAHYDHLAGMDELQRRLDVDAWMHPDDLPLAAALAQQAAMYDLPPATAPERIRPLADGQRLALGDGWLEVLHTPGHSPGSVTFRSGDTLWVGDLLFAGSIGRTDLPGGSFPALRHSVRQRLFPLGDALRVLPGHGPPTTLGAERRSNPFVGDGTPEAA